jgi:hypothetical protein
MIFTNRCSHTGVVNFFTSAEPFLAVGSVAESADCLQYHWRCYLDDPVGGTAPDIALAEAQLRSAITRRRRQQALAGH